MLHKDHTSRAKMNRNWQLNKKSIFTSSDTDYMDMFKNAVLTISCMFYVTKNNRGQNGHIALMCIMFKNHLPYFWWYLKEPECIFRKIIFFTIIINCISPGVGVLTYGRGKKVTSHIVLICKKKSPLLLLRLNKSWLHV